MWFCFMEDEFSIGLRKVGVSGFNVLLADVDCLSFVFTPPMNPVLIFLAIGVYKEHQIFDFY